MTRVYYSIATLLALFAATSASAITLDGMNIPSEGLTLRATQDAGTQFGNNLTADQTSSTGSELNQLFADIDNVNQVLEIGITGNLQNNFNKLWLFFDAIPGGENPLLNDNADGGFGEINAMAGLSFADAATMDHGLRFEVGGGFLGIRYFDLVDNVGGDIFTAGGDGDLPLSDSTVANGVSVGWDNSNILGVSDADATDAATATTGVEISIDLEDFFGNTQGDIRMTAFITSADGTFGSNQTLPGLGDGAPNVGGDYGTTTLGTVLIPGDPLFDPGDVNNDGNVDTLDFDIISMNWLETNESFGMDLTRGDGDLSGNGEVSIEDFREWKNEFLAAGGSTVAVAEAFASLGSSNVPEPSTVVLSVLAGAALLLVRRR